MHLDTAMKLIKLDNSHPVPDDGQSEPDRDTESVIMPTPASTRAGSPAPETPVQEPCKSVPDPSQDLKLESSPAPDPGPQGSVPPRVKRTVNKETAEKITNMFIDFQLRALRDMPPLLAQRRREETEAILRLQREKEQKERERQAVKEQEQKRFYDRTVAFGSMLANFHARNLRDCPKLLAENRRRERERDLQELEEQQWKRREEGAKHDPGQISNSSCTDTDTLETVLSDKATAADSVGSSSSANTSTGLNRGLHTQAHSMPVSPESPQAESSFAPLQLAVAQTSPRMHLPGDPNVSGPTPSEHPDIWASEPTLDGLEGQSTGEPGIEDLIAGRGQMNWMSKDHNKGKGKERDTDTYAGLSVCSHNHDGLIKPASRWDSRKPDIVDAEEVDAWVEQVMQEGRFEVLDGVPVTHGGMNDRQVP